MECYEIRVKSHLGTSCARYFEEFTIRSTPDGETVLVGWLADQTALHGVLVKIRDLGLPIIELRCITNANFPGLD